MKKMKTSFDGVRFIKREECVKTKAYLDQVGRLTIGVGHLLTEKEKETGVIVIGKQKVFWKNNLTMDQVEKLLEQDLAPREEVVNNLVKVQLNQTQFDALVSFVFNIGVFAFQTSTLLKLLNAYNYLAIPGEMKKWNKGTVGGKKVILPVLKARREREVKLWTKGDYDE